MFSQASAILFGGGGGGGGSRDGYRSGRYASYWNAFLLVNGIIFFDNDDVP